MSPFLDPLWFRLVIWLIWAASTGITVGMMIAENYTRPIIDSAVNVCALSTAFLVVHYTDPGRKWRR